MAPDRYLTGRRQQGVRGDCKNECTKKNMVSFNHKKACRYCSIYAAGHVAAFKNWPQEIQDGQHNPKVCPRAITELLKAGAAGASFLKERWGKNGKMTREIGQRRAGQ